MDKHEASIPQIKIQNRNKTPYKTKARAIILRIKKALANWLGDSFEN